MHADANRCPFTIVFNFIITSMTAKVIECLLMHLSAAIIGGRREVTPGHTQVWHRIH